MKRLNGWHRIGIVLSIIWMIVGGFWGNSIGIHEGDYVLLTYKECIAIAHQDWKACDADFRRDWPVAISNHWLYAALLGSVPIPLVWGSIYGIIGIIRWIRKGFIPPKE
jgi:hypothetical protein